MIADIDREAVEQLIVAAAPTALGEAEMAKLNQCLTFASILRVGLTPKLEFACAWGVVPPTVLSDEGYLWLFVTDKVADYEFRFIRESQIEIKRLLEVYPLIKGHVASDNRRAQRWLKWLGAKFGYPQGGAIPFEIRK